MNVSSEYISTDELFEITTKNELSDIWVKNPSICKWGYMGSISHSDYEYKLNNSNDVGSTFNRICDVFQVNPDPLINNLDYFYRIGDFNISGTTIYYYNQSTNIQCGDPYNDYLKDTSFRIDYYVQSNLDYFDYFFKNQMTYLSDGNYYVKEYLKFSMFHNGSIYDSSSTLFRGIQLKLSKIENIVRDTSTFIIDSVIINNNVNFNDYKCSIILNTYYSGFSDCVLSEDLSLNNSGYSFVDFPHTFNSGEVIEYYGVGYECVSTTSTPPYGYSINTGWTIVPYDSSGLTVDLSDPNTYVNNWIAFVMATFDNPPSVDFTINIKTLSNYAGYSWSFIISSGICSAPIIYTYDTTDWKPYVYTPYWTSCSYDPTFTKSTLSGNTYFDETINGVHIFLNDKYKNLLIILNVVIPIFTDWYDINNVATFGEKWGLYHGQTLDGWGLLPQTGITNKYYNPYILTANNFITLIDDLNNKYSYDQYVTYHYIDQNANYAYCIMSTSSSTMSSIPNWNKDYPPYFITALVPDHIELKKESYTTTPIIGPKYNIYNKYMTNPTDLSQIINEPLARIIQINEDELQSRPVINGETLEYHNDIFRFNGPYEPIFKDIPIFKKYYYCLSGDTWTCSKAAGVSTPDSSEDKVSVLPWNNISNVINCDGNCATVVFSLPTKPLKLLSTVLNLTNFGFNIPTNAQILHISVYVNKHASGIEPGSNGQTVSDSVVSLLKNNTTVGGNSASNNYWTTTPTVYQYTGTTDSLWNTTWIPEDINNTGFGVAFEILLYDNYYESIDG